MRSALATITLRRVSTAIAETERPATPRQVLAWGLWDWGTSGFNSVILTFVFSVYLTKKVGDDLPGSISATSWLSWSIGIAGLVIALLAPVSGQRFDAAGRRKQSLAILTALTVMSVAAMFFVEDSYQYLWLGLALLGFASVTAELATVPYNAMLTQLSTPSNIGRLSGFGWAMGYFGSIFLLVFCYFGFIAGEGTERGFFAIETTDGLNIRTVALVVAVWMAVFVMPVFFAVPEPTIPKNADPGAAEAGYIESYKVLWRDVRELWDEDRRTVYYLVASALFRDGLAGIFTFGGVLAATVYGLSAADVLLFGIAANVVAALGSIIAGRFDDKYGPKSVILTSLVGLVAIGFVLIMVSGHLMFWIFGLMMCTFVGPAQASARTYLAKLAPPGREGQLFGLYTMTGRAVSFLSPALFGLFVYLFAADRAGIVGLMIVLAGGAAAMWFVREPSEVAA
ncbi:MFS transporter [Smaragdicoccus niigatensis]